MGSYRPARQFPRRGSEAVELPGHGMAISQEPQTRTTPVQPVQVRCGVFLRWPWLPPGQGCQGQIVHGGFHPRHWHLQPDVFQPGQGGGRKCSGNARRASGAREWNRGCGGDARSGVHGWRAGGFHADAPHRSPACDFTSGGKRPYSASAAYPCEAAARSWFKASKRSNSSASVNVTRQP